MICNKCLVQMHQKDKIGGGRAEEMEYTTWEFKECPACGRKVVEYYAAVEVKNAVEELVIKDAINLKVAQMDIEEARDNMVENQIDDELLERAEREVES